MDSTELTFSCRILSLDQNFDEIKTLDSKNMSTVLKSPERTWFIIEGTDIDKIRKILLEEFRFHPLAVEDAVNTCERPSTFVASDTIFTTVPVIEISNGSFDTTHLGLFLCDNILVSVSSAPLAMTQSVIKRWTSPTHNYMLSQSDLLVDIIDTAVDDYFPAIDALQEEIDELEDQVYSGNGLGIHRPVRLKRNLLEIRRQITPIRDNINTLLRTDVLPIPDSARKYLQDVYDHTLRLLENVDINRDILTSIMDAQLAVQSNKLNEVMRNMTTLATILMVLALITGNYGMNFKHMPELDYPFGYPLVLASMVFIFIVGLLISAKIGWFKVSWPWKKSRSSES